ncbi:DNA polymerase III subunit delta [Chelativorans salis]|uniref:DNA polymerase III subunit delta n=1 Tax=Chelativorans salis TaxID=2978478 RepID=A0ABT2LPA8_9HYPH|nr:DNA polymerase III subunit delta [Chelativorans sp. EGI FJ00035]MCT7376254.1 DNA polymerase III subunit delta [Chelativorans sp. EGI FJ00035]
MAQKKAHEVDAWLARPDHDIPVVLIYGPDRGLVSERARMFAQKTGLPLDDPFTVVRIDATDMDQQGRLLDEARTVPMFAERRLVWVRGAANHSALAADVAALIADPPADSVVLIEAGDLKKSAALRTAVERGHSAMALPCYADDGRGIDAVIDEVLAAAGLSIALEARQLLKANLGGDRLASRGELEKLALYCADADEVTAEDVRAVIGDVSRLSADDAVDAVLGGRIAAFDTLFTRHLASGNPPFMVLSAALRQVQALQLMREQVDRQGKTPAAAVASTRPPVFFTRRRAVEQALQRWNQAMLQAAANRLQGAILKSRQHPAVAEPLSRQALLALAIEGARAAR